MSNVIGVTSALLNHLKVKHTKLGVTKSLTEHPAYPSLLAVEDCLNQFGIATLPLNIDKLCYNPEAMEYPFIAQLNQGVGRFIVLKTIKIGKVTYTDEKKGNAIIDEADFLKIWGGDILFAERTTDSIEPHYKQNCIKTIMQSMLFPFTILTFICGLYPVLTKQSV